MRRRACRIRGWDREVSQSLRRGIVWEAHDPFISERCSDFLAQCRPLLSRSQSVGVQEEKADPDRLSLLTFAGNHVVFAPARQDMLFDRAFSTGTLLMQALIAKAPVSR